ncbi:MAG: porin [Bacteroidales bacterium]
MRILTLSVALLLCSFNALYSANNNEKSEADSLNNLTRITDHKQFPKFDASIKTKYEYATKTNMSRFSVRNSRLGIAGNITDPVKYRIQVELSSEGKFEVLDLNGTIKLFKGFNLTLGQTSLPLFNSYITTPSQMLFANRAFVGKYFTGTRDIGALASYKTTFINFPVEIEFGIFNGSSINNPVWTNRPSYSGRVQFGSMNGIRATVKFYNNPHPGADDYKFKGIDLRYSAKYFKIEGEYMDRHNVTKNIHRSAFYLQGAYYFYLPDGKIIKNLIPALRWDEIGENLHLNNIDAGRFTFGLAFGFSDKQGGSLIRFDYEHYLVERPIAEFSKYEEMDSDKFTIELLIVF